MIMKAVALKGFGGVENLVEVDIPVPEPSDNEVLIEVKAIGINPIDVKTRKGKGLAEMLKDFDPLIPGWDVSGKVVRIGKQVTSFRRGDEVFGMVNFPGHGMTYAEYVVAPASHLALRPKCISHEEAAAASLAALTAWQILKYKAGIRNGSAVLIHAAAGGVGHYAIQMAKYLGASVVGTASSENRDFILDLGITRHINYRVDQFEDILQDIDFVLDTIGGDYIDRSLEVLRPGGTIIAIPSDASADVAEKAAAKGMKGFKFRVSSNGDDMVEIAGLLEKGLVRSVVSRIFSFKEIREAHQHIESGRTRGKIVVRL